MLQYNTISPSTLRTLRILMSDPKLQDFVLIGGTGLALHIGHRMSIDLDLTTLVINIFPNNHHIMSLVILANGFQTTILSLHFTFLSLQNSYLEPLC